MIVQLDSQTIIMMDSVAFEKTLRVKGEVKVTMAGQELDGQVRKQDVTQQAASYTY